MPLFVLATTLLSGCSLLERIATEAGVRPAPVAAAPAVPPAPSAPPVEPADPGASAVAYPPGHVPGVPGWLGVTVNPEGSENAGSGLVLAGTSPIVVLSEAWGSIPALVPVQRVDHAGLAPAPFVRAQTALYGCDGGHEVSVASFGGTSTDPLVWLVPPGVSAEPVALSVADTPTSRTWTVGGAALTLKLTGPDRIELVAPDGQTVLHVADLATQRMGGDEDSHLELASEFMVPQVLGAWRIDGALLVGARYASYEGDHYVVYTLGAPAAEHEVAYLYRCAF